MKSDAFEEKLQCQSLRKIPGNWRAEIVAAATGRKSEIESREQTGFSTSVARLATIFWPHPKAWAALAAIWIFIFAVNFSIRDSAPRIVEKSAPPSPEMVMELKKGAVVVCGTDGFARNAGRRPAENFLAKTAQ